MYKKACTRARAPCAVTLMDEDGVKRVPVARRFRYPADMSPADKCYDTCPIAIGS
ncbi:hypothetical protein GCM10027072_12170 [Streptomyces bullii]